MKAITLWQPHASWIGMKWKTIETRDHERFRSLVGQRVAIHAAKKIDVSAFFNESFAARMKSSLDVNNFMAWVAICCKKIVCTAVVDRALWVPGMYDDGGEGWSRMAMCEVSGKFCLFLRDIEPLANPVPYKGGRGIFNVPDELLSVSAPLREE